LLTSANKTLSNPRGAKSIAIFIARVLIDPVIDPLEFKFNNNLRPPCSKCGRPLILTRIEPDAPGFDLRVYYCAACESAQRVISHV